MQLVIFSSTLSLIALLTALGLYLLTAVARIVLGNRSGIVTAILGVLNFLTHIAIFAVCVYNKATAKEMLFILVISSALALTVTKVGKEEKGE